MLINREYSGCCPASIKRPARFQSLPPRWPAPAPLSAQRKTLAQEHLADTLVVDYFLWSAFHQNLSAVNDVRPIDDRQGFAHVVIIHQDTDATLFQVAD